MLVHSFFHVEVRRDYFFNSAGGDMVSVKIINLLEVI